MAWIIYGPILVLQMHAGIFIWSWCMRSLLFKDTCCVCDVARKKYRGSGKNMMYVGQWTGLIVYMFHGASQTNGIVYGINGCQIYNVPHDRYSKFSLNDTVLWLSLYWMHFIINHIWVCLTKKIPSVLIWIFKPGIWLVGSTAANQCLIKSLV